MSTSSTKETVSNQSGTSANTSSSNANNATTGTSANNTSNNTNSSNVNNTANSNVNNTANSNSSTIDPWAPQQQALIQAFQNAQGVYNNAAGVAAPTDFTAQMSPGALAAFQQMISQGSNLGVSNGQAATGTALQGAGTSGLTGALSGLSGYNASDANNPQNLVSAAQQYVNGQNIPDQVKNAMLGATQTARDVTLPGIEQNAATTGNVNSTRTGIAEGLVQRGLAQQSAALNGALSGQAYANGLNLAQSQANNNNTLNLGALNSAGSLGNTAAANGVNAGTQSVGTQGALSSEAAAGGAGMTAAQQANLDNQYKQYLQATQGVYGPLQGLMSIIGSQNWGSSSNGTSTGTSTGSSTGTSSGSSSGSSNGSSNGSTTGNTSTTANSQDNGMTTGQGNSTTTSTPSAWDTISGLLSGGGSLLKAFSDRRVKKDITRIGTLDNGLPLYTFRYNWQNADTALNVGLMAQDVEEVNPDAVSEINGIKVVDYKLACA